MLRFGVLFASLFLAGFALADNCSTCTAETKVKECCESKAAVKECCADKVSAKACRTTTLQWDSELNESPDTRERAFWATTNAMLMTSEGGKSPKPMVCDPAAKALKAKTAGECEKSTPEKRVAKGGDGCCNQKGLAAKFKVWAGGGYHFFGCEDSAAAGRSELNMRGMVAGGVQPVLSRQAIN